MNGVSEDERFAVCEEVEGGGSAVEVPVESACGVAGESIDDRSRERVDDGEHGLEIGQGISLPLAMAECVDLEVDDLSGDGV